MRKKNLHLWSCFKLNIQYEKEGGVHGGVASHARVAIALLSPVESGVVIVEDPRVIE